MFCYFFFSWPKCKRRCNAETPYTDFFVSILVLFCFVLFFFVFVCFCFVFGRISKLCLKTTKSDPYWAECSEMYHVYCILISQSYACGCLRQTSFYAYTYLSGESPVEYPNILQATVTSRLLQNCVAATVPNRAESLRRTSNLPSYSDVPFTSRHSYE